MGSILYLHQHHNTMPPFWTIGCIYGASAVTLGAFGAHGLKKRIADPAKLANWGTAAQYQLIHSGILLVATTAAPKNTLAASLFVAGMTMFSGVWEEVADSEGVESVRYGTGTSVV